MTVTRRSTVAQVTVVVAGALNRAGIHAVLTGGACASLHSRGAYQSHDLDFIIDGGTTRQRLDAAMASAEFHRQHDRYVHRETPFFVEFPRGPLAVGDDHTIRPVRLKLGRGTVLALSATDACRDRLAAFYHWADRQSLVAAVAIAQQGRVNVASVRRWSVREGFAEKCGEFLMAVGPRRRRRRTPAK